MKKTKKMLLIAVAAAAMLMGMILVIASIIAQIEEAVAAQAQHLFSQQREEDLDAQQLEHFTVTGSKSGSDYRLAFQFDGWRIDDIRLKMSGNKGTLAQTVQIPSVLGTRQQMAYQFLRQHGFTPEGACGLMANIHAESSFIENREEGNAAYRGETALNRGWGICQWTNTGGNTRGRRYQAIRYVRGKGFDPAKRSEKMYLAELQYAITEKGYTGIVNRMRNCTDVTEATRIWCTEWERPANMYAQAAARASVAKKYLKQFRNQSIRTGSNMQDVKLNLTLTKSGDTVSFAGTLDGIEIAGSFTVKNGACSGSGEWGQGASAALGGAGSIQNPFGSRKFYITSVALVMRWGKMHEGWDLDGGDTGTPIYAVSGGTVAYAGGMGGYGSHVVVISSGSMYVLYGHMCRMNVHKGQNVSAGQRIGSMGNEGHSFGAHLHLEFRRNTLYGTSTANVKNVDPMFRRWASNYNSVKSQFGRCVR